MPYIYKPELSKKSTSIIPDKSYNHSVLTSPTFQGAHNTGNIANTELSPLTATQVFKTIASLFTVPLGLYYIALIVSKALAPLASMGHSVAAYPTFFIVQSMLALACIGLSYKTASILRAHISLSKKDWVATSLTAGLLAFTFGSATGYLEGALRFI